MDATPTISNAASCILTERNVFRCAFTEPKTTGVGFWADYGVHIKAHKVLDDNTLSDVGDYGAFWFTVDDEPPRFTPKFQQRFRDNVDITIGVSVENEKHALSADLEILGEHYSPLYASKNGSMYYFTWHVPDYGVEGTTNMVISMSDFAGNSRSVTVPVYVDLTPPRMSNVQVDVSDTVIIGGERFTSQPTAVITGRFIDDDITKIWAQPGNFNATTGVTDNRTYGLVQFDASGGSVSFTVTVALPDPNRGRAVMAPFEYNDMLISYINELKLYARDIAGHENSMDLRVIRDIAAPRTPTFCLGSEWYDCV
jgi:hypothetical protein